MSDVLSPTNTLGPAGNPDIIPKTSDISLGISRGNIQGRPDCSGSSIVAMNPAQTIDEVTRIEPVIHGSDHVSAGSPTYFAKRLRQYLHEKDRQSPMLTL